MIYVKLPHLDYVMYDTGNSIGNMGGLQPSPQAWSVVRAKSGREYLSVTSQLMVESRNDRAENAWGLGWVELCSRWNPFLWNLTWSTNSYPFSWTNFTKRSSPVLGLKVRHVLFSYSAIASWIVDLKASEVKISKTSKLMLKSICRWESWGINWVASSLFQAHR